MIHVKGSTNTYRFKSRTDWHSIIKVEGDGVGVSATWTLGVEKEPVSVFLVVYEEDFAYTTRPAPKRPRLEEPQQDGEYWLKVDYPNRKWLKLIVFRGGSIWFFVIGDLGPNVFTPYPTWVDVLRNINPLEVLSAEGYYMRKAKGKL